MGTKSKGTIKTVEIYTGIKKEGKKRETKFIDVRLQSNNLCKNIPDNYNPHNMKIVKRSLRVVK